MIYVFKYEPFVHLKFSFGLLSWNKSIKCNSMMCQRIKISVKQQGNISLRIETEWNAQSFIIFWVTGKNLATPFNKIEIVKNKLNLSYSLLKFSGLNEFETLLW